MFSSIHSLRLLAIGASLALTLSTASQARETNVRRDLDHGGHSNTQRIHLTDHSHGGHGDHHGDFHGGHGDFHGGHGDFHGGHYYGHGRYYGGRFYGGYYGYGYPYYGYPYYGYPYYYGPGVTFSFGRGRGYGYGSSLDTTVDVQRALKRRGYYHGSIDGVLGPETRSALRDFQSSKHRDVTGRIDDRTLRDLDID
jgi:hypothetical protein